MSEENKEHTEFVDVWTRLEQLAIKMDVLSVDIALIKNLLIAQCELMKKGPTNQCRMRPPRKKIEKQHPHTRVSIATPWLAELEVDQESRLYKELLRYDGKGVWQIQKFVGRSFEGTILDLEKIRLFTESPHPQFFRSFFNQLIKNPHNCCFYIQGERPFICVSEDDHWNRVSPKAEFWDMVRYYLWETYRRYTDCAICLIIEKHPERTDILDQLSKQIRHRNRDDIPLTKTYIAQLLTCVQTQGGTSNCSALKSAYMNRKK